MFQHRLIFIGVWLTGVVLLRIFPGFEAKGLAGGLIAGWWPFLFWREPSRNPWLGLGLMFVLSGLAVWACAWTMDKAKLRKTACLVLVLSVTAGALSGYLWRHDGFEDWKQWHATIESPGLSYEPSRSDFNRSILIPWVLMCGMWGLYAAALGCAGFSSIRLIHGVQSRPEPA